MKPNRKNLLLAASAAITIAFTAPLASAAPYSWIGADAGTWNTTGNWSGSLVPTISDDLTILGPLNAAAALTIDFNADNSAQSLIFTNTFATSLTNTTSGADKTLTLGSGGITTGTGAVQIGANVANQAVNITLGAAQTWNVGAGGLSVTNVVGGAATGITKTGSGNLTFNGNTVNSFTGGLNANGGTVTLDYNNLASPTNLVAATNALQMSSGALTITGKNVAASTTAQTFAGTTLGAGLNTVNIAKGALATSATLNLGVLTVNSGSSAIFVPTTASVWSTTASTTEKVFITAGGSVPALPGAGTTAFVGGSVFHRVGTQGVGSLRLAAVDEFGQLLNKANAGNLAIGTGVDPTGSYQLAAGSIALTGPATSVYGLLLNANTNPVTITVPNSGTLTLNSVIQIKTTEGVTIAPGTGVSNVVIGAEKNLVIAMDNAAGFAISAPIANFNSTGGTGGDASGVTIVGTNSSAGGVTLSGSNTYSGVTTVDGTAQTGSKSLLTVGNNNALGTTDGGTVLIGGQAASGDGGRIVLNNGITVTGETLTIRTGGTGNRSTLTQASNATSAWNGNIVVDANTGFGQIFANGTTGVMTIGASDANTLILNGTQSFRGTGIGTVNSTISGVGGLGKTDAGTWTLTAANSYSGTTSITSTGMLQIGAGSTTGTLGTGNVSLNATTARLQFNRTNTYALAAGNLVTGTGAVTLANTGSVATAVDGQFNTTGALNFGSSAASTTVSALDLTNGSSTFGSLLVQNNSASNNTITIGAAKTLNITGGAVQIGATTPAITGTVTKLVMTGGGALVHNGTTFLVGGNAAGAGILQDATLDLRGLSSATITTSGNFRVAPNTGTNNGSSATMFLPTPAVADTVATTTITSSGTNGISVGNSGAFSSASTMIDTLQLGTGLTRLSAVKINVGAEQVSGNLRDIGQLIFGQAAGDLVIRGADGISAVTSFNLGTGPPSTGSTSLSPTLFDSSGHDADILVTTLNIGSYIRTAGAQTYQFKFGEGNNSLTGGFSSKLDVTSVSIGYRAAGTSSTITNTSKLDISGGTVVFGNVGATGTGVSIGTSDYNQVGISTFNSELNISAGAVTIHNGTGGYAVRLGQSSAVNSGIVNASMNLTGGTTNLTGDIVRGTATGTVNSTLKISGGTLDMGGNDIGAADLGAVTLTAESGTLSNVATINGTGGLTKTTAGTLVLSGTNTYTGDTTVSAGTLTLSSAPDPLNANTGNDASTVTIAATGATLNLTYTGTDLVDKLFIGASQKPAGVYGHTNSGATNGGLGVGAMDAYFGPGTGTLTVASGTNYASWILGFFPGETNPAIIGADADPDNDGIENGVEMVIGGNPATGMDTALLPTLELVNADPDGDTTFADYLLFTYRRTDLSVTAGVTANCETDTDLVAPWTLATGAPGVVILTDDNFPSFTPPAANTDRVRVYVPRGANTTLFGRLNVVVP